ncbi:hypothetical protein GPECTOR_5g454 [Gonium pectorale]|uniref:Uncharacterized protein n=1 Tax=Gonium pectorale TaxID=33097 RepID=A0A150GX45_GONPE|nr:hypothetical protein GPECTOR_5g454 [Gonium pectorale]|eukprot:KXZ54375.1 hypothetical protein GPECTOR_5g454 [Gonium pectorale]
MGGGVFAFMHRNTRYGELLAPDSLTDPSLCPLNATAAARRLLQQGPDAPSPFSLDMYLRAAGTWLGASAGGALLVGLLFVWLVKVSPAGLVAVALGLQVAVPAGVAGVALSQGAVGPGVALLVFAGLTLLLFALWRPQSCCFVLAASWAAAVMLISYATTWARQADASPEQARASAALTALVALLAGWAVLAFLAALLLNVVDALFVCVGMDRDRGQVCSEDVHAVLAKLPSVGAVVEQPDGGLVYGAPPGHQQPPAHPYGRQWGSPAQV